MSLDFVRKHLFYRMHPETALRYLPIVDLIKNKGFINMKILEVGSGSYGITPYLNKEVVGVDTSFDEPDFPLLKQVKASATKLPFKDNEFDITILSDVLEHLPKKLRDKTLFEATRVSKVCLIVSGPFGAEPARQDKKLADYSIKKLGKMHYFFSDHLRYGLPEESDIMKFALSLKKVKDVKVIGSYLNLKVRELLMKFFISNNKFIFYFYLKGLMLLVPLLRLCNFKPCYRKLILINLK